MSMSVKPISGVIIVTDDSGRLAIDEEQAFEPEPGSVVLTQGQHGTAWQRWFSDGKWHSCHRPGQAKPWSWLLGQRNMFLVYEAPTREERER